mgnify:CR=1 FL=1
MKNRKKTTKTLLTVIFILSTLAGGLAYAEYIDYEYVPKERGGESIPENISLTLGDYGTYKAIYDENEKKWTIGLWEGSIISPGTKDINNLSKEGGVIQFAMPWNGHINNNAGEIYINGKLWHNGNPSLNDKGKSYIKKGSGVEIRYERDNQSAGFQIWLY